MLVRIAKKPTYGFEILREIESKTDGGWRPGPGSVYPILKNLVKQGYVKSKTEGGRKADHRLFTITPKGVKRLSEARELFGKVTKNWGSLRGILVDLVEPAAIPGFVVEGTRKQFELAQEIVKQNREKLTQEDLKSMLVEYRQVLETQHRWATNELEGFGSEVLPGLLKIRESRRTDSKGMRK